MKEQNEYRKGMLQHDSWHAFDPENIIEKKKYFISEKFTSCYSKINCDGMRGEAQNALILLQTSRYLLKYNSDELLLKIVLMQVINLTVLSKSGSPPNRYWFWLPTLGLRLRMIKGISLSADCGHWHPELHAAKNCFFLMYFLLILLYLL